MLISFVNLREEIHTMCLAINIHKTSTIGPLNDIVLIDHMFAT